MATKVTSRRLTQRAKSKPTPAPTSVLGEVGQVVAAGLALGVAAALAGTRLLSGFFFGVTPADPRTLAESVAVLSAVAFVAGALPAWRAARLDPMRTLREE